MNIPGNRIADVRRYFDEQLKDLYSPSEIMALFRMASEKINGWSMIQIHLEPDTRINESDLLQYSFFVKRLRKNEPVQYIMGKAWFCGLEIGVAPGVLIPRPETEELVNGLLELGIHENAVMLDACTGSGCIALALKNYLPNAQVFACDLSEEALAIAQKNASELDLDVQFFQADLLQPIQTELPALDVLISNPPYIPISEREGMATHVKEQEPHMALFVPDEDPMLFYRHLATQGLALLKPGALLLAESHSALTAEVAACWNAAGYEAVEIHDDLSGLPRWLSARRV
jgi:release factor glutamine methyltransferase